MARFGGRTIVTEEDTEPLQSIVNGDGTSTIAYLDRLRAASTPFVSSIADQINSDLGLVSEVNSKKAAAALGKSLRPTTLSNYPWFQLSHLRDYLRFRTYLNTPDDFLSVMSRFELLQSQGAINLVKIDTAKLGRPGPFGWRMVATDFRIVASGLIVEHYMTFTDMIRINEDWLHSVYEKWRGSSTAGLTIGQAAALDRDSRFSRKAYLAFLIDDILRSSPGVPALRAARRFNDDTVVNLLVSRI